MPAIVSTQTKRCSRCGEEKSLDDFFASRGSKDGRHSYCKSCSKEKAKEWRDANPERMAEYSLRFRERRYGLSREDLWVFLMLQDERCAICTRRFDGTPYIDHNHQSGEFRGLLCSNCNTAIGFLNDDPIAAERASRYLSGSGVFGLILETA